MSIYLDSIKKHDISIPLGLSLPGSNCMVVVGAYQPCGSGYITAFFNGIIDEVRVYNRALSDSEIKVLYEATKLTPRINADPTRINTDNNLPGL
jgi:hypothetical protein